MSGEVVTNAFVSIIVPVHNEAEHIEECLASLVAQEYEPFEVIVVDNASSDDSASRCRQFPTVKYVYFDRLRSSYAARNEGARQSRGDVLMFFDADQTAERDCLRRLLSEFVPSDPYHIYHGELADDQRIPRLLRMYAAYGSNCSTISTSCVALPRPLFDELGAFKGEILSCGDVEFFERAKLIARVHRAPGTCGNHYWARTFEDVFAREERYGFGCCLRARAEGKRMPSVLVELAGLLRLLLLQAAVGATIPFRCQRDEWRERWLGQSLHWYSRYRRMIGVLRFRLGQSRAGDLPK